MSVWKLISENKFEEACAEADLEIASAGLEKAFNKGNKVIALLKSGRVAEAGVQCEMNRQSRGHETAFDSIFLGVALWLQNKREAAIEAWFRATKAQYVDAGGGVESRMLLLYAAKAQGLADLEVEALRMLTKLPSLKADLKLPNSRPGWPRPLASFALGRMTRDEVRETLSQYSTENLQPLLYKHSCQAEFYFGVISQDPVERKKHFWRAGYDYVPASYGMAEHHLAIFEFNAFKNDG